jgi:hypothetical protein
MELPINIEHEIIEYLNVEYGIYQEIEKIKKSDLSYVGEFVINGKSINYWEYPCSTEPKCWATVEPYEDSYLISITTHQPNK